MDKKKYKIGDKVRIKNIKYEESDSYMFGINPSMECYANKVLTIDYIDWNDTYPEYTIYKMIEDKHRWNWSKSMFVSFTKGFIDLKIII